MRSCLQLSCPYSGTADRRHPPHRQNSARPHLPVLFHAPAHSPVSVCGGSYPVLTALPRAGVRRHTAAAAPDRAEHPNLCPWLPRPIPAFCGVYRLSSSGRPLLPCGHPHLHQRRPVPEQPDGVSGAYPVRRGLSAPRQGVSLSDTALPQCLCLLPGGLSSHLCPLPDGCGPVPDPRHLSPQAGAPLTVSPCAALPRKLRALLPGGFSPGAGGSSSDQFLRSPRQRAADSKQARRSQPGRRAAARRTPRTRISSFIL